jgi:uncharacterized protein
VRPETKKTAVGWLAPLLAIGIVLLVAWVPGVRASAAAPEDGQVLLEVRDVIPLGEQQGHVVMLVSQDESQVVPILVDTEAAIAIAFRLAHRSSPYPLAEDLLDDVVRGMGGEVTRVELTEVEGDRFKTRVYVQQGRKRHAFAARPSESIALALTSGAKIFASPAVMSSASISRDELHRLSEEEQQGVGGSGPPSEPERRPRYEL